MKHTAFIATLIVCVALGSTAVAQSSEESFVKILPAAKPGVIKVMYAKEGGVPVEIKFITKDGLAGSDKIKAGRFPKGFLKKYDISKISQRDFVVEVSSPTVIVTYRMTPSGDRHTFTSSLEKVQYNTALAAK